MNSEHKVRSGTLFVLDNPPPRWKYRLMLGETKINSSSPAQFLFHKVADYDPS
jgi:hypothetical protein